MYIFVKSIILEFKGQNAEVWGRETGAWCLWVAVVPP